MKDKSLHRNQESLLNNILANALETDFSDWDFNIDQYGMVAFTNSPSNKIVSFVRNKAPDSLADKIVVAYIPPGHPVKKSAQLKEDSESYFAGFEDQEYICAGCISSLPEEQAKDLFNTIKSIVKI